MLCNSILSEIELNSRPFKLDLELSKSLAHRSLNYLGLSLSLHRPRFESLHLDRCPLLSPLESMNFSVLSWFLCLS
ncbi:hypothetical protein L6452_17772 [Arctium lappa]|uniref:Uncharacterized protein n=1 Tax=Arctium lappa TaxID=4217 RepID=A0ACB9C4J8_ARCLA|nr:hypothetical protein L6452_17772 [Arctium lappa]